MADNRDKFRIGLVQMRTGKDIQENLGQAEAFIRDESYAVPRETEVLEPTNGHKAEVEVD